MAFERKPIHDLKNTDIEYLLEAKEPEGKNVEYKSSLTLSTSDEKREFLADISSFANTAGGHIVFGVKEEKGIPVELSGIEIENADVEKIRIANIIQDGITPRIQGLSVEPVDLKNGRLALVIYIPKSYSAPHMVSYQGSSRFYARHAVGKKYQMDVQELRQAFLLSETVSDKIKDFRLSRVAQINAEETPVELYGKEKIIIHIVPLTSFTTYQSINLSNIREDALRFLSDMSLYRYNIDGFISWRTRANGKAGGYFQVFRAGQIEYVESDLIRTNDGSSYFPSLIMKKNIIKACYGSLHLQKKYSIEQPILIFISLTGVEGARLAVDPMYFDADRVGFDRDVILTREIMLEDYPADEAQLRSLLKPILDEIWNAAGYLESPSDK